MSTSPLITRRRALVVFARAAATGFLGTALIVTAGCAELEGKMLKSADSLVATTAADTFSPFETATADATATLRAMLGTSSVLSVDASGSQPMASSLVVTAPVTSSSATASAPASDSATPFVATAPQQPTFDTRKYLGKPITTVPNGKREVAITFDDGPSVHTGKVLSILKKNGVHATFFFVGDRAARQDGRVSEVIAQGSEVGGHTWSHVELSHLKPGQLDVQIDRTQEMLAAETGSAPKFVRPRSGKFDAAGASAVWRRGLILVEWSQHANDVEPSPSPSKLIANATKGVRSGSIILLHETNPNTIVALPALLAKLRREGYHPVTLSQLMADGR